MRVTLFGGNIHENNGVINYEVSENNGAVIVIYTGVPYWSRNFISGDGVAQSV
jgi:hypothetical protein